VISYLLYPNLNELFGTLREEHEDEIDELEAKIGDLEETVDDLDEQVGRLHDEAIHLTEHMDRLTERVKQLTEENEQLKNSGAKPDPFDTCWAEHVAELDLFEHDMELEYQFDKEREETMRDYNHDTAVLEERIQRLEETIEELKSGTTSEVKTNG